MTSGLSWSSLYRDVAEALVHATAGDEAWAADGTYFGIITVAEDVSLYGACPLSL